MKFVGIDLAWSPRNRTGGAVLVGDAAGAALVDAPVLLGDDQEIVAYIEQHTADESAIVAIDAPLWVPNETGRRPGEAEIGKWFQRYQAGAHPANRQRLTFDGVVRGEALVAALAERGFVHRPRIAAGVATRQVIEVFPHPAMVAIFKLERTLKYKTKPNRSPEVLFEAWHRYQHYLRALAHADPPLHAHEPFLDHDVSILNGRQRKAYEDQVDALFCAYIALYGFRWGDERCRVFGTMEGGYIYTPVPETMR